MFMPYPYRDYSATGQIHPIH